MKGEGMKDFLSFAGRCAGSIFLSSSVPACNDFCPKNKPKRSFVSTAIQR